MSRSLPAGFDRSDVGRALVALLATSVGLGLAGWILPGIAFDGAWPVVRAAVDPDAESGEFYGPAQVFGLRGNPVVQAPVSSSASPEFGSRLWALAEEWSGVDFDLT